MNVKTIYLAFLFFFPAYVYATNVDSLKNLLTREIPDSNRFIIYEELLWSVLYVDPNKSLHYADSCMEIANRLASDKLKTNTYLNYANCYIILRQLDSALAKVEIGELLAQKNNFEGFSNRMMGTKANIYILQEKNEEASTIIEVLLAKHLITQDSQQLVNNFTNLGTLKQKMQQYKEAIAYFLSALDYAATPETIGRKGIIYMNIGVLYGELKELETATEYYLQAQDILTRQKDTLYLAINYNNLGQVFSDRKLYQEAEDYYRASLKINTFHLPGLAASNYGLGSIYHKTNKYPLALKHAKKALDFDQQINNVLNIPGDHDLIGQIFYAQKKYDQALTQYRLAEKFDKGSPLSLGKISIQRNILSALLEKNRQSSINQQLNTIFALQDSFDLLTKQETINEIKTKYQTEKKEAENQLLLKEQSLQNATIQNQRKTLFGGLFGSLLLGIITCLLYRQNKNKRKNIKLLSEKNHKIQTLHTELNHRVKNNLAFVSSLMKLQSRRLINPEAKQAVAESESRIAAMSILHRKLSLDGEEREINLGEYLEELCQNIAYTFPNLDRPPKIHFEMKPISFDTQKSVWIGLIINELVTNSFKYAFEHQENPQIFIKLEQSSQHSLNMSYRDNGIGLPEGIHLKNLPSLGLKLIHTLTEQLDGSIQMENKNGANFDFSFQNNQVIA